MVVESPYLNKKDLLIITDLETKKTISFHFVHTAAQQTNIPATAVIALLTKAIYDYSKYPHIHCCEAKLLITGMASILVFTGLMKPQDLIIFSDEVHAYFKRDKLKKYNVEED